MFHRVYCFVEVWFCGLGLKAVIFYGVCVQDDLRNDAQVPLSFTGMRSTLAFESCLGCAIRQDLGACTWWLIPVSK